MRDSPEGRLKALRFLRNVKVRHLTRRTGGSRTRNAGSGAGPATAAPAPARLGTRTREARSSSPGPHRAVLELLLHAGDRPGAGDRGAHTGRGAALGAMRVGQDTRCAGLRPLRGAGPAASRTSVLDEYKPYVDERWSEGRTNAWKLWEEIVPLGYRGSYGRISAYLRERRTSPRPVTAQPPAPRVVTRWFASSRCPACSCSSRRRRLPRQLPLWNEQLSTPSITQSVPNVCYEEQFGQRCRAADPAVSMPSAAGRQAAPGGPSVAERGRRAGTTRVRPGRPRKPGRG